MALSVPIMVTYTDEPLVEQFPDSLKWKCVYENHKRLYQDAVDGVSPSMYKGSREDKASYAAYHVKKIAEAKRWDLVDPRKTGQSLTQMWGDMAIPNAAYLGLREDCPKNIRAKCDRLIMPDRTILNPLAVYHALTKDAPEEEIEYGLWVLSFAMVFPQVPVLYMDEDKYPTVTKYIDRFVVPVLPLKDESSIDAMLEYHKPQEVELTEEDLRAYPREKGWRKRLGGEI